MFSSLTNTSLGRSLAPTWWIVSDLNRLIVVGIVAALVWGVALSPLTYITLRRQNG